MNPRARLRHAWLVPAFLVLLVPAARGDEWPALPRQLPPAGKALKDADRPKVQAALDKLEKRLAALPREGKAADLLPDVEVYAKAVRYALLHDEFYKDGDVKAALNVAAAGEERLDALEKNQHPWTAQKGVLVRGYRSAIDGSAQPYGLEIPDDVDPAKPVPLYVWLHGRGDTGTDLSFIASHQGGKRGQIKPAGAIVVNVFGRHCVGYKSAGEIDVLDVVASVESRYKIDPDRVVLMGFSMGGAGAWHVGAHYADHFAAVHAGAGFVDVAQYKHLTPEQYPSWYEQKLWGAYDVYDYTRNFFNTTMVAYGGEIDPQRASSEIMEAAFKAEGHKLTRIVGPKMPHKYDPASLAEIMKLMAAAVEKGNDRRAKQVFVETRTLRYHKMHWASIEGLGEHWIDSRLDATLASADHVNVTTKNVTRLAIDDLWANAPVDKAVAVTIDGKPVAATAKDFRAGRAEFAKTGTGWALAPQEQGQAGALRKRPGLQGPIDDVWMAPFLVVLPSGKCGSAAVQKWTDFESKHFQDRWRALMRGDARVKRDTEVTPDDIQKYNLVLWGDAAANALTAKVVGDLPVQWGAKFVIANDKSYDAGTHVPAMIYPNPLNPAKYVVLNSGLTFREDSDKTNSLQNPKLPDWAVIDVTVAPNVSAPGKVDDAGFFDEAWQFKAHAAERAQGK